MDDFLVINVWYVGHPTLILTLNPYLRKRSVVILKYEFHEKGRLGDEHDPGQEEGDDEDPVDAAVLLQDDVAEDHDEDGRAEDDRGRVAHGQPREPDEDAGHGHAANDPWVKGQLIA